MDKIDEASVNIATNLFKKNKSMKIACHFFSFCLITATLLFVSCGKDEPEPLSVTVTAVTPADQATGILISAEVSITFSRAISKNASTLVGIMLLDPSGAEVAATKTFNDAGTIVVIKPSAMLAQSTSYKISVKNVSTDDGAIAPVFTSTFKTLAGAPLIVSSLPANNAVDVENLTKVVVTFNKKIAKTALNIIGMDLGEYVNGTVYGFSQTQVTPTISEDGLSVTFTLAANLASPGSIYYATFRDLAAEDGGVLKAGSIKFTTKNAPLGFASITPANGATDIALNSKVVIVFNKPMKSATLPGVMIMGFPGESWMASFDGYKTLTLSCGTPLKADSKYELWKIGDIVSFSGEKMEKLPDYSFTTGK